MSVADFPFTPEQRKWIDELKSGNRKQTKSTLENVEEDGSSSFCCLGVACSMYIPETRYHQDVHDPTDVYYGSTVIYDTMAPPEVSELLHLRNPEGIIDYTHVPEPIRDTMKDEWLGRPNSLAALNDKGWTFQQIAEFIEAHPRAVFKNAD